MEANSNKRAMRAFVSQKTVDSNNSNMKVKLLIMTLNTLATPKTLPKEK